MSNSLNLTLMCGGEINHRTGEDYEHNEYFIMLSDNYAEKTLLWRTTADELINDMLEMFGNETLLEHVATNYGEGFYDVSEYTAKHINFCGKIYGPDEWDKVTIKEAMEA